MGKHPGHPNSDDPDVPCLEMSGINRPNLGGCILALLTLAGWSNDTDSKQHLSWAPCFYMVVSPVHSHSNVCANTYIYIYIHI